MINLSSNLALFGSFDSFAGISKACIGMVWHLLRVHKVDSTLTTTWPYLCTLSDRFPQNMPAILVHAAFNTVFINLDEEAFKEAAPPYQKALQKSGYSTDRFNLTSWRGIKKHNCCRDRVDARHVLLVIKAVKEPVWYKLHLRALFATVGCVSSRIREFRFGIIPR